MTIEKSQPDSMIIPACRNLIRLFRYMAWVMANQRSIVITVSVKTDKWLANTVKNPATLQPSPGENTLLNYKVWYDKIINTLTVLPVEGVIKIFPHWMSINRGDKQ